MRIDFVSIFPEMFDSYFGESIIKRAREKKLIDLRTHNLRDWATDKHHKVDDRPFGGGPGMVMMVEPFARALKALRAKSGQWVVGSGQTKKSRIILMAASGKQFTHADAVRLSKYKQLVFLCPRYEGVDARVEELVDEKISIGPYVLTGGELPAMVVADAVARHIPGVLGKAASLAEESHSVIGLTEYPQYTRPENYKNKKVPNVLLSGDHAKIAAWRKSKMRKAK